MAWWSEPTLRRGYQHLYLALHSASVEFARANTPDEAGLSALATYPQQFTNQTPNYVKLTHPTTTYLCSLATLEQSFQLCGKEFDAKHWRKKKKNYKSQWRRAVNPGSQRCLLLACPSFGLHRVCDSARDSEHRDRSEINVLEEEIEGRKVFSVGE